MSKMLFQFRWPLAASVLVLLFFLFGVESRKREPNYFALSENIQCDEDSSAELVAAAWQSLENDNLPRALACSRETILRYDNQATLQQRQLGAVIPADPNEYSELNDVATAWLIQGKTLYTISKKSAHHATEKLYALSAYQLATNRYPSAYALYADGGYWPVRQAAFCHSYQHFPEYATQKPTIYTDQHHFSDCYLPSGFMPAKPKYDTTVDMGWPISPHSGQTCIQVKYSAMSEGWEGVYLQYPEDNWGAEPGLNLGEVSALTFWAKGESGGEVVEFKIGGIRADGLPYYDSLESSLGTVTLSPQWEQYTINLNGLKTNSIIGGFAWVVTAQNNPNGAMFYLDDIAFVE